MAEYIVPLILAVTAIAALRRRENAYDILTDGAKEGFSMLLTIAPALIVLLGAVGMLRSSGALEAFSAVLSLRIDARMQMFLRRRIGRECFQLLNSADCTTGRVKDCAICLQILQCHQFVVSAVFRNIGKFGKFIAGRI